MKLTPFYMILMDFTIIFMSFGLFFMNRIFILRDFNPFLLDLSILLCGFEFQNALNTTLKRPFYPIFSHFARIFFSFCKIFVSF